MSLRVHPWFKQWLLPGLILGFLWLTLINNLRLEWSVNPQYRYGWAVPFLCLYLVYLGIQKSELRSQESGAKNETGDAENHQSLTGTRNSELTTQNWLLFGLAFAWLPVRLIEEANPQWRLSSWALALIVVGLTLALLRRLSVDSRSIPSCLRTGKDPANVTRTLLSAPEDAPLAAAGSAGVQPAEEADVTKSSTGVPPASSSPPICLRPSAFRFQDFVFPILFFLVAIPWPTVIEAPLIQWLTRANAACGIELLNLLGVPAVQHGNVIEVGTGVVGIDEACSGIRSFQASLMISLFFGEMYRLAAARRVLFVMAGFGLSFTFNVGRTTLLTWVAARDGVQAIDRWHDTAGVSILLGCFISLWLLGLFLSRRSTRQSSTGVAPASPAPNSAFRIPHFPSSLLWSLAAWLLICEITVEGWYRWHERGLDRAVTWVMQPPDNPTYREMEMPEGPKVILRATDTIMGGWQESDGTRWQAIYLRWAPGRVAAHLAQGHTPDHCLPAAGRKVISTSPVNSVVVNGLNLPVRFYVVEESAGLLHVAYCQWQDRKAAQSVESDDIVSWRSRLGNVKFGRRNLGERSLELAVWGLNDAAEAERAFRVQFEKLIRVEK